MTGSASKTNSPAIACRPAPCPRAAGGNVEALIIWAPARPSASPPQAGSLGPGDEAPAAHYLWPLSLPSFLKKKTFHHAWPQWWSRWKEPMVGSPAPGDQQDSICPVPQVLSCGSPADSPGEFGWASFAFSGDERSRTWLGDSLESVCPSVRELVGRGHNCQNMADTQFGPWLTLVSAPHSGGQGTRPP